MQGKRAQEEEDKDPQDIGIPVGFVSLAAYLLRKRNKCSLLAYKKTPYCFCF